MRFPAAIRLILVLSVGAAVCPAQVVTDQLVLYLDANTDTNGTDGWDFTQPAVGGGGGTLPALNAGNAPTSKVTAQGGRFFRSSAQLQFFSGAVTSTAMNGTDGFTYEIWLRANGSPFSVNNQVAYWSRDLSSSAGNFNFCAVDLHAAGSADAFSADFELQDFLKFPEPPPDNIKLPDQAGVGQGEWHQLIFAYDDASSEVSGDGVLRVYLDGDPNPVSAVSNLVPYLLGNGSLPFSSELAFASAFINQGNQPTRNFNGDIAIIRLYRDLLLPFEITQNFNAHTNLYSIGPEPPLVPDPVPLVDVLELQIDTVDGEVYELDRTADLTAGSNAWESTGALIQGDGGTMRMYDPADTGDLGYNRVRFSEP
jgi:hypothetical protein